MTRDELSRLSFSDLVDLILRLQTEVVRLQMRVAGMEMRERLAPPPPVAQAMPATILAPSTAPPPVFTQQTMASQVRVRRSHRHRPWYRKLWRVVKPQNQKLGAAVLVVAALVVALSIIGVMALSKVLMGGYLR